MRNLRLLLGVSIFWLALSVLSDGLNSLVLPKLLLDRAGNAAGSGTGEAAGSATILGLLTFGGLAAGMLVQPLAGQWSDHLRPRLGRQAVIGLGLLLVLVALAGLGWAAHGPAVGLSALAAAYLAVQIAASLAQAGQQGLIPDLVEPPQRGLAAGWKGLMDTGGATLGFLLLGGLLGGSIAPALLAIAGVLAACYLLAVLLVREGNRPPPSGRTSAPPLTRSVLDAFRLDLRRHGGFARVVLARFLFLLGTYAVGRFLLLYIADRLALDPSRAAEETGLLLAVLTLVTALAAPLGGWAADRLGRTPLMVAGSLLSAAGALGLIGADSQPLILVCGLVMALGSAAFTAANWALTTELAPRAEAARFMALANFGTAGGAAAAGLFGVLVDWGNRQGPGYGYTLLFGAAAVALLAAIPAIHRLPAVQSDSIIHMHPM